MLQRFFEKHRVLLLIATTILSLLIVGLVRVNAPQSPTLVFLDMSPMQSQQNSAPQHLMRGKVASLGWIVGRDCQRGMQAYLKTADTNPDAALVGTGWVDPTNGHLINGQSNNCMPGSLSMDNVVQLVHSKSGMVYLTVTLETAGSCSRLYRHHGCRSILRLPRTNCQCPMAPTTPGIHITNDAANAAAYYLGVTPLWRYVAFRGRKMGF